MNKHMYPERYHPHLNKKKHFEGWYYKQVSSDGKHTISLIPGVSYNAFGSHSFIQCLSYNEQTGLDAYNIDFPISDFQSTDSPFEVFINGNLFSYKKISLNINTPELVLQGTISFQGITPIQTTKIHPNIMGLFSYIPYMQCNHAILSMNHLLIGQLNINGEIVDFSNGKGYIEKDWGRSFPSKYIWVQSNHFNNSTVSLFCSIAKIPFGLLTFTGFICNFIHNGMEYRFATYNGSKLTIEELTNETFHIHLKNKNHTLYMIGSTESTMDLLAPKLGAMNTTIKEGLSGKVHVALKKNTGELIYESNSNQCGIELEYTS